MVLDTLTPPERVAFVLHDMFAVPFEEIALIVGKSTQAARQLASRARHRVQGQQADRDGDRRRQSRLVGAFLARAAFVMRWSEGRIVEIEIVADPHRLRTLEIVL